jgi:hypothetical protein
MQMEAHEASADPVPRFFSAWMCKQARKELHWAFSELAHNANCTLKVVRNFEASGEAPLEDQAKIYAALRAGGLARLDKLANILRCEYSALATLPAE